MRHPSKRTLDKEVILPAVLGSVNRFVADHLPGSYRNCGEDNILLDCLFCEPSGKHTDTRALSFELSTGAWNCKRCNRSGGIVEIVAEREGISLPHGFPRVLEYLDQHYCNGNGNTTAREGRSRVKKMAEEYSPEPGHHDIEEVYRYVNEDSVEIYRVVRLMRNGEKSFRQAHPDPTSSTRWRLGRNDIDKVLYNLPAVTDTVKSGGTIEIHEGERKCDRSNEQEPDNHNRIATTKGSASSKWEERYTDVLRGAHEVIIWRDRDEPGRKQADEIYVALHNVVDDIRIVESATTDESDDVVDHLEAGYPLDRAIPVDPPEIVVTDKTAPPADTAADDAPCILREISLVDLATKEIKNIEWVVPGFIARGEVALLIAEAKHLKTVGLSQMVLDLLLGRPLFGLLDGPGKPLRIMWVDEEVGTEGAHLVMCRLRNGCGFSDEEIELAASRFKYLPMQGLDLGDDNQLQALFKLIREFEPDLLIMDSFSALQTGNEMDGGDRQRFFSQVLVPIKEVYGCPVLLTAHPPLPSKNAPPGSQKRVRGSSVAQNMASRSCTFDSKLEKKTPDGKIYSSTVTVTPHLSRIGDGVQPFFLTLTGEMNDPWVVTAESFDSLEAQKRFGKVMACQYSIMEILREKGGRVYQPWLIKQLEEERDYGSQTRKKAMAELIQEERISLGNTESPNPANKEIPWLAGGTGKWIMLEDENDDD